MGAPTKFTNNFAHVASSSQGGVTTIFTHGSSLKNPDGSLGFGGVLDRLVVTNGDIVAHTIQVYRVPSSSSATDAFTIDSVTLGPASSSTGYKPSYVLEGPFYSTDTDSYQAKLDAPVSSASTLLVFYQAWYHEMS